MSIKVNGLTEIQFKNLVEWEIIAWWIRVELQLRNLVE